MARRITGATMAGVMLLLAGCEVSEAPADSEVNVAAPANQAAPANEAAPANAAAPAPPANQAAGPADPSESEKPLAIAAAADLDWGACPPGLPQGCEIAVLHGDPAKPNADIFLRVPGGSAIAPHWHSSAERMMLVSGRLEVRYQGSPPTTLDAGTYAYGPARLPHRADCRSATPCTLFIAFEGPVDRHDFDGEL